MSMRVFHAYLFKEKAKIEDLAEVQAYLNKLKEKFIKWVPEQMIKWSKPMELDDFDRLKKLEKDTRSLEKGGVWDFQLTCTVYTQKVKGKNYLALQFFPSNMVVKFLRDNVKLREFWYENQTDEGFDLPDYDLRREFWDKVFEKYWAPAEAGLNYSFYEGNDWTTGMKIIRGLKRLEEERKKDAENSVQQS